GRLFQYFGADMDHAVAIIDGACPIPRPLGIDGIADHVVMRFVRFGVVCVSLGVGEGDVDENELSRIRPRRGHNYKQKSGQQRKQPHSCSSEVLDDWHLVPPTRGPAFGTSVSSTE